MNLTRMFSAGLAVLLVATLPLVAQPSLPPTNEDLQLQLKSIQADLKLLSLLEVSQRLRAIEDRLRKIEDILVSREGSTRSMFYHSEAETPIPVRLRNLEERLRSVEMKTDPRISRSFTPVPAVPLAPSAIRMENRSGLPAVVYLNDIPYPLAPGERRTLTNQQPGPYTYEVEVPGFTERAIRTEVLPPGGYTGLITIRP